MIYSELVNIADLAHNLDMSRFEGCDDWRIEKAEKRRSKYESAREILLQENTGER